MFRASSAHLQEDTVVYMQHMVLSLSLRVRGGLSVHSLSLVGRLLVGVLRHPPTTFPLQSVLTQAVYYRSPRTLIESDSTICCMYTTVSSRRFSTWVSKHV